LERIVLHANQNGERQAKNNIDRIDDRDAGVVPVGMFRVGCMRARWDYLRDIEMIHAESPLTLARFDLNKGVNVI